MSFTNPIARAALQAKFYESSTQRSPRDSESIARSHIKHRATGGQIANMLQNIEQLQRQLNRLRKRTSGGFTGLTERFPFQIYLSPPNPAWGQVEKDAKSWRTFRVRNGFIELHEVAHTDRVENPYSDEVPPYFGVVDNPANDNSCDFVVAEDAAPAYVWVDVRTGKYTVFISENPPGLTGQYESWTFDSGWDDSNFVLIGWIDTKTDKTTKHARVMQLVEDNLPVYPTNLYRLKEEKGDYLVCKSFNGLVDGKTDCYIAKVHKLRTSITTELIEQVTYYYKYDADGDIELNLVPRERVARTGNPTTGPIVETCVVTPEWLSNDLIYAVPCHTGVSRVATTDTDVVPKGMAVGVNLLMLGDGRAWAVHA